jgi:hypothetical protein
MRFLNLKKLLLAILPLFMIPIIISAQDTVATTQPTVSRDMIKEYLSYYDSIQNFRYYDMKGINVFETPKTGTTFNGLRVRFGAGFTQGFQNLKHENYLTDVPATSVPPAETGNMLFKLSPGFNTAMANLNMDVQLADGIRLNLVTYLSSRHHNEAWVKGGYIQFDKLPFKGEFWDNIMKLVTLKVGHMEINYGDAHFRRSDGGQTLYNPFIENYIIDAFTTEIGAEGYINFRGFFGMLGVSNGEIKGDVKEVNQLPTDPVAKKSPAVYLKGGFDKSLGDLRVRGTASFYQDNSSASNTLFWGDRTGSNYFMVMENTAATTTSGAWSGRVNPGFTDRTQGIMLNGFLKFKGLEGFATYETGKGRGASQTLQEDRNFTQFAIDGLYRLRLGSQNFYGGVRYNTVALEQLFVSGATQKISEVNINRVSIAGGWFLTKNVLIKGEYVVQEYNDYGAAGVPKNIYLGKNGAASKFSGYVVEAVVGF